MPVNNVSFGALDMIFTRHFTYIQSINKLLLGCIIKSKNRLCKGIIQYIEITLWHIKNLSKQTHCVIRRLMCSCLIVGYS